MKVRTVLQLSREGIHDVWKNRMMSIASIGIVVATLFVFGILLSLTLNVNSFAKGVGTKLDIRVFLIKGISDIQTDKVAFSIHNITGVKKVKYISGEEAVKLVQKKWGINKDIFRDLQIEKDKPFRSSFDIRLSNAKYAENAAKEIRSLEGVNKIVYSKDTIRTLLKINKLVNISSAVLIIILCLMSVFIISNTIKLTVMARRKEISIMKLIGATDIFIRWPFVIEGVAIGFIAAIVAIILTQISYHYCYTAIAEKFSMLKLIRFGEIFPLLLYSFFGIGIIIGGAGSFISVRRYLRV